MRPMEVTTTMGDVQSNAGPNRRATVNVSTVYPNRRHDIQPPRTTQNNREDEQQEPAPTTMPYAPAGQLEPIRLSQELLACGCVAYIPQVQQVHPPFGMMFQQVRMQAPQSFVNPIRFVPSIPFYYGLPYQVMQPPPVQAQMPRQAVYANAQAMPMPPRNGPRPTPTPPPPPPPPPAPRVFGNHPQPVQAARTHFAPNNTSGSRPVALVYPVRY